MTLSHNGDDLSSITSAKEHRFTAKEWSKLSYHRFKKGFLILFAILAAGFLELFIVYLYNN